MEITVLRDALKSGLSFTERACSKSTTLPILQCVSLVAEKNKATLSATDLEMGIRYVILSKTESEGGVAVPSRFFSQLAGFLQESQISLSSSSAGVRIASKTHDTLLKTMPLEDFPIIPSLQGDERALEIDARALCAGLAQIVSLTGQTQGRPEISGVFFAFQGDALRLAATDSFRLGEKTIPLPKNQEAGVSFILPQKTARELCAILQDQTGRIKIYAASSQVLFDYAFSDPAKGVSAQVVSRLVEGEYPKYQDVIPGNFKTKIVLERNALISHLRTASVFSGKLNDVLVSIDPKEQGVKIVTKNSEAGEHSSFISGDVTGEPLDISFNWKFFLDGASQFKAKDIEIGFAGEEAPALLKSAGTPEAYLYVMMPLRS